MKTWGEYEAWLRRLNPKVFAARKIELTPTALMARLEAAWHAGHRAGAAWERDSKSLFQTLFG